MDITGFVQLEQPKKNDSGEWYIRADVADGVNGEYRYLVLGVAFGGPKLLTIEDAHNAGYRLLAMTFGEANDELKYYYEFHGAVDLYNKLMYSLKPSNDAESQAMEFV